MYETSIEGAEFTLRRPRRTPPPQPPQTDPTPPTTPGSVVRATVPGASHHKRAWELHDDGKWCDSHGGRRSPAHLRDIDVLWIAPAAEGGAA